MSTAFGVGLFIVGAVIVACALASAIKSTVLPRATRNRV